MRPVRTWMLFVALCLALSAACKDDPMDRARAAVAYERPDEAENALKEVLAAAPNDFEARRLMADVHRFRGEFEITEEALQALWDEKKFGEEQDRAPEERAQRDLLENQYNELYRSWSAKLDPAKQPEKFEKVVRAGLKWNKKSPTLNNLLVDHFLARAQKLEDEGKKVEAAKAYEEVLQLRVLRSQRTDVSAKASRLRKEAFADEANTQFETIKADLVAAEQFAEDTGALTVTIEVDVDKRLRQNRDADLELARKAAVPMIRAAIAQWVAKVTGVSASVAAATSPQMGSGDEKLGRGTYSVKVSMLLTDVINAAFDAKQKAEAAEVAEKPAETNSPDVGEGGDAPTDGATNGAAQEGASEKE